MIDNLTPSQQTVMTAIDTAIADGKRLFVLWYGGVRAGKSTGAVMGMLRHSLEHTGKTYLVCSYTQRQAMAVLMPTFQSLAEDMGLKYKGSRSTSNPYMEIGENHFLIFGGNDVGRDRHIQGITAAGLLIDEYPLLNPDFVAQAEARVSIPGALRIYTANKTNPYHWSTLRYYNRAKSGEIDALLVDTDTSENQHIEQSFIDEKVKEYDDIHRIRFINNDFTLDKEPIYQPQLQETECLPILYALNVSGADAYIISLTANGRQGYTVCAAETAYPQSVTETVTELGTVLINADRPVMARDFRRRGYAVKGYLDGFEPRRVDMLQSCLASGKILVKPGLTDFMQAIDEYSTAGVYRCNIIKAFEAIGEYAYRRN